LQSIHPYYTGMHRDTMSQICAMSQCHINSTCSRFCLIIAWVYWKIIAENIEYERGVFTGKRQTEPTENELSPLAECRTL
jgi:hypothetical protein